MIEEAVYNKMQNLMKGMLEASGNVGEAFLQVLIAIHNKNKEKNEYKGISDVPLKELLKAVRKGDNLMTLSVYDEDAKEFKDILEKTGISKFTMCDLTTDDRKILLFAQSDLEQVKKALSIFYAERGIMSEMEPDAFFTGSKDHNLSMVTGLDDVELEIIRYHSRTEPFPYTVVDTAEGISLLFREEDRKKIDSMLNKVSFALSGEQGPIVRQQVEIKLKGRQEVNIALEEAERESYIIDKKNPQNYIAVTAEDFTYYKNNKNIESIPRTEKGAPEAVYTRIESLTEPVVISKNEFALSGPEKRKLLESKTAVYPTGFSAMDEDIEKLNLKSHNQETKAYAEKFGIYSIDNEDNSLDTILSRIQQIQSESNRDQKDKSLDDIQYR